MILEHEFVIETDDDITIALTKARQLLHQLSFSEIEMQKVLVSTSELTRNVLDHTEDKGIVSFHIVNGGIQVIVTDQGKGIPNLQAVLNGQKSEFSKGLGIGLSAVHRLMDDVKVYSSEGGTKIIATKWRYHSPKYFK